MWRRDLMLLTAIALLGLLGGLVLSSYGDSGMVLAFMDGLPGCW